MATRDFFILHGEKVAVGVVGAICAYLIFSAFTNEEIRAAGASDKNIAKDISDTDSYRSIAKPPVLMPVPEYASEMKERFGRPINANRLMAWTTVHPDLGHSGTPGKLSYVYVYELQAPKLEITDAIGSFELAISVPEAQRPAGSRLSDQADVSPAWSRTDDRVIKNTATIVGALVEMQTGKGNWVKLNDGKMIPSAEFHKAVAVPTVDYETYGFRAKLVLAATGFTFSDAPGGEVLVTEGRWMELPKTPVEDDFNKLMGAINLGENQTLKKLANLLRPVAVDGFQPSERESAFVGPSSAPISKRAPSAVKFQLVKLEPDPADPEQFQAVILLTKLMRANGSEGWLELQKFVVKKGMKLGVPLEGEPKKKIDDPTDKFPNTPVEVDLATPFVLEELNHEVPRTYFYQIKAVSREDGKGKNLEAKKVPEDKLTDTVKFKNTMTNEPLILAKLEKITRPAGENVMITPDLATIDEKAAFEKNHAFMQQDLQPLPPTKWAPNAGPLQPLIQNGDALATDTDYFEMPDGRLYYWEPNGKTIRKTWKLGTAPKVKDETATPEVKPEPKPEIPKPATPKVTPEKIKPPVRPKTTPPPGGAGGPGGGGAPGGGGGPSGGTGAPPSGGPTGPSSGNLPPRP